MMTIDDMLSEVAKITGVAPQQQSAKLKEPVKTEKPEINTIHIIKEETKPSFIMKQRPVLSLKIAKEITYCIEKIAEVIGTKAVISVADSSGNLIMLEAMDDSLIASIKASQEKAYTAVALKMPTHDALEASRGGVLDGYVSGNGILMLAGGYPLQYNGCIVGSIGVSGGTKDQDLILAKAGVSYFEKRINL